jgi:hypothetical protein
MITAGPMETPDPYEEPRGRARAHAAPRGAARGSMGVVLLLVALVAVIGGGVFVAVHLAYSESSAPATTNGSAPATANGSSPAGRTTATKGGARAGASPSRASASRRRAVLAVGSVLAFGGRGRSAARRGDWAGALRNREATLARLDRIRAGGALAGPAGFLRAALRASIRADRLRVRCGCGAENAQDVAATELKTRFLAGFNPLASRYLRRTYAEPDI